MTVNHDVAGSSPAGGAMKNRSLCGLFFLFLFKMARKTHPENTSGVGVFPSWLSRRKASPAVAILTGCWNLPRRTNRQVAIYMKIFTDSIALYKNLVYNKITEQQCISFLEGMASRHLFTYIYRIHCTSPTKVFKKKLLLNGLVQLSLTAPL